MPVRVELTAPSDATVVCGFCPIARAFEVSGTRWTLLAVRELFLGNHRFDEIVRRTGAPRDILTTRLRALETSGFVTGERYSQRPPRWCEYRLTELGPSLEAVLATLRAFGDDHLAEAASRRSPVYRHTCGHTFHPQVLCGACGDAPAFVDLPLR